MRVAYLPTFALIMRVLVNKSVEKQMSDMCSSQK